MIARSLAGPNWLESVSKTGNLHVPPQRFHFAFRLDQVRDVQEREKYGGDLAILSAHHRPEHGSMAYAGGRSVSSGWALALSNR